MTRLPIQPLVTDAAPSVVDRAVWQSELEELIIREKAHTREGDAIAAARRRLPMTPVASDATVVGSDGEVPFVEAFEGRRQLVGYFHMWHDGNPWPDQCEGCTFFTAQAQRPAYLHSRDVTLAIFTQGSYQESRPYFDFVENRLPLYSARNSAGLTQGRDFGYLASFLRVGDEIFETYWSTGRGTEAMSWSYNLLDMTVFGRQETWEDSPAGWPQELGMRGEQFRVAGRPTIQWSVTDEPVDSAASSQGIPTCH